MNSFRSFLKSRIDSSHNYLQVGLSENSFQTQSYKTVSDVPDWTRKPEKKPEDDDGNLRLQKSYLNLI